MLNNFNDEKGMHFGTDDTLAGGGQKKEQGEQGEESEIDFSDFFKFYDEVLKRFEEDQKPYELTTMEQYSEKDQRLDVPLKDPKFIIHAIGTLIAQTVKAEDDRDYSLNEENNLEGAKYGEIGMLAGLKRADFFLRIAKGASVSAAYDQTNNYARERLHDSLNFYIIYSRSKEVDDQSLSLENTTYTDIERYVRKYYDDEQMAEATIDRWKDLSQKYLARINEYLETDSTEEVKVRDQTEKI